MKVLTNMKLTMKINLLVLGIILSLSTVIGFVAYNEITKGVKEFATEKAKGDLKLAYSYIENKFYGNWEVKGDKLYKGSTMMNENYGVVDKIGKDTGDTVTIFLGDTRIATNVMVDNKRAIGTQVSAEVAEKVLKQGENFYGEANVAGNIYQTAYMPLKDQRGETIGIFYVGAPQNIVDKILFKFSVEFLIILAVTILLSTILVFLFTYRIRKRLQAVTNAMALAGNGDFTTEIRDNSKDELGQLAVSYNLMTSNLKGMLNEVIIASKEVSYSSEELTASAEQTSKATETITVSIQEVASGAEHSTASVNESASALEEVTSRVQSISESASFISQVSSQATEKAKEGGDFVSKTVNQINSIDRSVKESGEVLKSLDQRSQEIGDISEVISGIAEQTNLLALNAAIEAARAGEQGKGFAVVANEVKKLAEQSRESSSQISKLVLDIQKEMALSNQSMRQVSGDVKNGLQIVQQTEVSFKEILSYIESLVNHINDMAATTEEVTANIEEITSSVSEISNVSNETSMHTQSVAASAEQQLASMEEIAASAHSLSKLADDLQKIVYRFKI